MSRDDAPDLDTRVRRLIAGHLGCDPDFDWTASLIDDLGADSLDSVELVAAVEDEFGAQVPDAVADRWRLAGDVRDAVRELA